MMSQTTVNPILADTALVQRCEAMGWVVLLTDVSGNLLSRHLPAGAWLEEAVTSTPMFVSALRRAAERWASRDEPQAVELFRGCWVVPVPQFTRRRIVGYHLAMCLTSDLLETDQFRFTLDATQLDYESTLRRLNPVTMPRPCDVARITPLLQWMCGDLSKLERTESEIATLSSNLSETYEELNLVYNLSAHLSVTEDPVRFIDDALAEARQVIGLKWVALQLTGADVRLEALSGRLLVAGDSGHDHAQLKALGAELLNWFTADEAVIVDDTRTMHLDSVVNFARRMILVPLIVGDRRLGIMFSGDKQDMGDLTNVDSKLLTTVCQHIGIFLENAMLYDDQQDMFMGTLRALVNSIDAKDSYTCGHSERVARLSRQLAAAAGLDAGTVERVHLSGLVHDIGKIGVPEAVLCKPGRLTDEEFDMIKAHPEIGHRILQDIRQMADLLPGVLHHHERFDGRGYPRGLKGTDIPLFGRLICLADSFDAMSSDRTYRRAMQPPQVLQEIARCAGSQFDPDLAAVFVKLDFTDFQRLLTEHQRRPSILSQTLGSQS